VKTSFLARVILGVMVITLAAATVAATEVSMGPSVLSPLTMVILTNLLLFSLFVLLIAALTRVSSGKYYSRIRLREPKIGRRNVYNMWQIFKWLLRVVIVIAIIVALFFLIYYSIKLAPIAIGRVGGHLSNSKENQTSKGSQNPTTSVLSENLTDEPQGLSVNQGGKASSTELFSRIIMDYGGYVILGFIILIILVSVIGRKISC